jgi:hypothetical protein
MRPLGLSAAVLAVVLLAACRKGNAEHLDSTAPDTTPAISPTISDSTAPDTTPAAATMKTDSAPRVKPPGHP